MAVLGADTARALEGAMRSWQPVDRECNLAARISAALEERLIFIADGSRGPVPITNTADWPTTADGRPAILPL